MKLSFSLVLVTATLSSAYDFTVKKVNSPPHVLGSRATPNLQLIVDQTLSESSFNLNSVHDLIYIANITVGGVDYPVQLDTGSSDLFIHGDSSPLPGTQQTNLTHNLTYAIGWAYGNVGYAPVEFIGQGNKVPSQIFLDATDVKNPALTYGAAGIAGLGFTRLSSLDALINKTNEAKGRSLLYNLFATNMSTPNFIAFALQRGKQPGDDVQGRFSIGELDPKYARVAGSNRIPTWPIRNPYRWNILVDAVIVNGSIVVPSTRVVDAPSNKAVTLVDSGSSYSYAPKRVCDAIYGNIPGASFDSTLGYWKVPCGVEINMALQIAGEIFPIHPLDMNPTSALDSTTCIGSFVPQQFSIGTDFDWIIGDNFLRSAYSLYDFGDFDSNGVMGDPYLKLLSIIDADEASIEFHNLRGGTPKTNITFTGLDGASIAPSFSISNDISQSLDLIGKFIPAMLGIVALNALVVIICCVVWLISFCRKRRRRNFVGRTPRRRLSPMNHRNSYIAGVADPSTISHHTYNPVSMALTEDTFVPPSPAFHRYEKKAKPESINMTPYDPTSAPEDAFLPPSPGVHYDNERFSLTETEINGTGATEHRTSMANNVTDVNSLRHKRVSLRDDGVSLKHEGVSLRDEGVSLRDEGSGVRLRDERNGFQNENVDRVSLSGASNHLPSIDPLSQELTSANGTGQWQSPNIQEPVADPSDAAYYPPPQAIAIPYSQHFSAPTQNAFVPPAQMFHHMSLNPTPGPAIEPLLPPPKRSYASSQRSSQVYQTSQGVDLGSIA